MNNLSFNQLVDSLNKVLNQKDVEESLELNDLKKQRVLILSNTGLCYIRSNDLLKSVAMDEQVYLKL